MDNDATRDDDSAEAFPDPDARMLAGASGTPATLADGREWLLADGGLANALDEVRDRMFDESSTKGSVRMDDARFAAWKMLQANYSLSPDEGRALILGADNDALANAVIAALFGPTDGRKGYTAWASSALIANGVDPASVPGEVRAHVLNHLVATGRAIPCGDFVGAIVKASVLDSLRAMAKSRVGG